MTTGIGAGCGFQEPCEVSIDGALDGITVAEVGRVVGYADGSMPDHFCEIITGLISDLRQLCSVRAGYRIAGVSLREGRSDGLEIGGTFFSPQGIITAQLHLAEQAALFACTIGPRMEQLAGSLFKNGDPVKGHFVDTIASIAVEKAADTLHDVIAMRMLDHKLAVTNRFSPGYCGWPVAEQLALFGFFPEDFCGITVTDSALMLPKKSVSGIIGIGARVQREPYFCSRCTKKECTYRTFLLTRNKKDGVL